MLPRRRRAIPSLIAVAAGSLSLLATPTAQATPKRAEVSQRATLSQLATQVATALRGSSVTHLDYRISIAGVGTINHGSTYATAPASNQKLFTTITALEDLGGSFHYSTAVSGTAPLAGHTLHGDLVLTGSGDPTLNRTDLASLAGRLHALGLHRVTGRLVVDDTRYSKATIEPGWKSAFVPTETGRVDAFSVDENEWRGGRAFNADPTKDNAALWRKALTKAKITVVGATRITAAPTSLQPLLSHRSAALSTIMAHLLTDSDNFEAEMLLREIGAQTSGHGTAAGGVRAERALAAAWRVPLGTVYDGSGLSYRDRETPATIEAWLARLRLDPTNWYTIFSSLPLACATGTLEHRLCLPATTGRVRAKTGTLYHVTNLSGYFEAESGDEVTFSILGSGFDDSDYPEIYRHVDAAVAVVSRRG